MKITHVLTGLCCLVLTSCTTLPPAPITAAGNALPPAQHGELASLSGELLARAPARHSALQLIERADEAMFWRLALIDKAVKSIDAQYFIWKGDATGTLLLEQIFAAAERGVKVRLLIDDMYLVSESAYQSPDAALAAIDSHPNIELKIFNPGRYRSGLFGMAGNIGLTMKEFNRRMHNKLLIADGKFMLIGGRNMGDEYYGLHAPYNFLDLDVVATGPVVRQSVSAFDDYWNSDYAYPASALVENVEQDWRTVRSVDQEYLDTQRDRLGVYLEQDSVDRILRESRTRMRFADAVFIQDEAVKRGEDEVRLYDVLEYMMKPPHKESIIVTPYLIPVGNFMQLVEEDASNNVNVQLVTNSLASTDHAAVHSHYRKYRKTVLSSGAELYEFREDPGEVLRSYSEVGPQPEGQFIGLHPKAGVHDRQRCFIGSLNMDPRAVVINTENGLYIEGEPVCGQVHDFLESLTDPDNAWKVELDDTDKLTWTSSKGKLDKQPARGTGQRFADFFYRLLPIESQL